LVATASCAASSARSKSPRKPIRVASVESFNSRARNELFAREVFDSVVEAKVIYGEWRAEYNNERPHSSLRGMTPVQFFSLAECSANFSATFVWTD
jgi:putative transposase